jgi:hypothetical protein
MIPFYSGRQTVISVLFQPPIETRGHITEEYPDRAALLKNTANPERTVEEFTGRGPHEA